MPSFAMFAALQGIALRHNAFYAPKGTPDTITELTSHTLFALGQLRKSGFALSEKALHAFNGLSAEEQGVILENIDNVFAVKMNWTPLVRDWQTPTGQTWMDMAFTFLYNVYDKVKEEKMPGTRLRCGHVIPDGVFDLPRYTGCPFCGEPFEVSDKVNFGQGSHTRVLDVLTDADMASLMRNLLEMRTPLDATQLDSLQVLLKYYPIPEDVDITMKETLVAVMAFYIEGGQPERLIGLVNSPSDVLRFLWYVHTGQPKVIRPHTLINLSKAAWSHFCPDFDRAFFAIEERKMVLRLYFPRFMGRIMAGLLAKMEMPAEAMCQAMHPHRNLWVHLIRALRLPEYARKKGNEKLREVLDRFYRGDYPVLQGEIDRARLQNDFESTMKKLRKRPGAFARQLFANMLWFGPERVIDQFRKVIPNLPTRLIISLGNAAEMYFDPDAPRPVRIITNQTVEVEKPSLLFSYSPEQQNDMIIMVKGLLLDALSLKYGMMPKGNFTHIHIDPVLDTCVLPVGERSASLQDSASAVPGMTFPIEGDKVRLFLFWGEGMPAQPLDLDLAADIFYDDSGTKCFYGNLTVPGAQHSGDIRKIPDNVGTAEYIELDIPALLASGAKFVVFSASNYSGGQLPANTRVGWMSSESPMKVDNETGVAYDPSCVQMMVRLPRNIESRTIFFGVLDLEKREIVYMENYDGEQVVNNGNASVALGIIRKLRNKITIGQALRLLARAQGLEEVSAEALAADSSLAATTAVYGPDTIANIPELMRTLIPD